jgi:hypothetical protein
MKLERRLSPRDRKTNHKVELLWVLAVCASGAFAWYLLLKVLR